MTKRVFNSFWCSLLCLCFAFSTNAQSTQDCNSPNISMSCQNLVHISLGQSCNQVITPDQILAGSFSCYNTFNVNILNTNLGNTVGAAQIGQTLNVQVKHTISGNSCWGKIKIEDKLAPALICPADATLSCAAANLDVSPYDKIVCDNIANNAIPDTCYSVFGMPNVQENCTGYTLSYSDLINDTDCNVAGVSAIITRTWKAKDAFGNTSTCSVVYTLLREEINLIVFPADVTIECSSNYKKDAKGNPHPDVSGAPTLNGTKVFPSLAGYCEMSASYLDAKTLSCGNTYKVIRKWTVIDWCTSKVSQYTQVVKVADTTPPTIVAYPSDLTVSTDVNSCVKKNFVPTKPTITDNCGSKFTFFYTLYEPGTTLVLKQGDTLRNVAIGKYLMEIKVTDECGNFSKDSLNLTLEDGVPPVAVCDLNTKVVLANNGLATVDALTFDDGSIDNCGIDVSRFEVKRMGAPDADYNSSINFNCNDDKLQVILRVWDYGNLSNTCMVNVDVDDKNAPEVIAENTTLNCAHEPEIKLWLDAHKPELRKYPDLPTSTNYGYYDNCSATLTIIKEVNSINNCGVGSFTRTWKVTDASGNTATTEQVVYTVNRSAYKVTFPADKTLTCTKNSLDLTPKANGEPIIDDLGSSCPFVEVSYSDDKYSLTNDGCYKIVRKWKILNDCDNDGTYDPDHGDEYIPTDTLGNCLTKNPRCFVNISNSVEFDPIYKDFMKQFACFDYDEDGYMEYVQIIKVIDTDVPVIGNVKVVIEDNPQGDCNLGGTVKIDKVDVTDCSDSLTITFTSNIPNNTFGKIPAELKNVPYGKYSMTINVNDRCGNYSTKVIDIEVKEQKKPTPVCKDNIAVSLMANGLVMVPAVLINAASYDNCTPANKLKFRLQVPAPGPNAIFSETNTDTMYTFSCANIKTGTTTDYSTVALWVGDEAGNWDYCETIVVIQDNMGSCTNNTPIQMKIAGIIKTPSSAGVQDVTMKIDGDATLVTSTDNQGKFKFDNIYSTKNYELTPSKIKDPLNGVSTLDIVLISKHILGTQPFTTMYQSLAGDINNSGNVSTADIVELRKMILGLQNDFSKNTSWRFVETGKTYDPIKTDWIATLPNKKAFLNLQSNPVADFIAVKVGDVNGNAVANSVSGNASPRRESTTYFEVDKNEITKGELTTLRFSSDKNNEIEGFQFTLKYDKNAMELIDIQGDKDQFALLEDGVITTSQNGNFDNHNLFGLTFKAKTNAKLADVLHVNSQIVNNELYTAQGETNKVDLRFKGTVNTTFALFQNQPNPFNSSTVIEFQLPESQKATLTVTDVAGRVVKQYTGDFEKGMNKINIQKEDLGTSGIYYYRLETAAGAASRKMIIVE